MRASSAVVAYGVDGALEGGLLASLDLAGISRLAGYEAIVVLRALEARRGGRAAEVAVDARSIDVPAPRRVERPAIVPLRQDGLAADDTCSLREPEEQDPGGVAHEDV